MSAAPSAARVAAIRVVKVLQRAGHQALFAGGCVRDQLLGRDAKDFDVATSAHPDEVLSLFPRATAVGRSFGVILVHSEEHSTEVATFRAEADYEDGRRPGSVHFTDAQTDAGRRDFTINALFLDPVTDQLFDFVEGQSDLHHRLIRTVGDPHARFAEDHLRMLRAVRFAAALDFSVHPDTADAIQAHASSIRRISAERIQQELTRLLTESSRPGSGLRLLHETGLLVHLLPEVAAMVGQAQPAEFHPEGDVFTHTCMMLDAMQHPTPTLAYAVLLHDVGKPPTAAATREPDGSTRIRFNGHARVGADMAREILQRLRMPKRHIEAISHCVENHMRFMEVQKMRPATLRRLTGNLTFPVELELHRLDCLCSHGDISNHEFLVDYLAHREDEPRLPPNWVTGHDIMALGVPEGPEVGEWMARAYEAQLDGHHADRAALLAWLRGEVAGRRSE